MQLGARSSSCRCEKVGGGDGPGGARSIGQFGTAYRRRRSALGGFRSEIDSFEMVQLQSARTVHRARTSPENTEHVKCALWRVCLPADVK
jgi:hypothetical protein